MGKLYSTKYPSGLGHIGYIIVDKTRRGKGVGTKLLQETLSNYLSDAKAVSLYSSSEEIPFYEKMGFNVVEIVVRMTLTLPTTLTNANPNTRVLEPNIKHKLLENCKVGE